MDEHNLDIKSYNLNELFAIFNLTHSTINAETLKEAKTKVLKMHPDKSKLDPQYFLFYKKAFETLVLMYENKIKTTRFVDKNREYVYIPENVSDISTKQLEKTIDTIDTTTFHTKFNQLFEQHGSISNKRKKEDKNEWFTSTDSSFEALSQNINNNKELTQEFERIKSHIKQNNLINYNGVMPLQNNSGTSGLYDEDGEDDDVYLTSDLFSKLKYDDLRKVHKDQTIIAVSESDIANVTIYNSVDDYQQARSSIDMAPMQKDKAEEKIKRERIQLEKQVLQRHYNSEIRTTVAVENNKNMLSHFLRISN